MATNVMIFLRIISPNTKRYIPKAFLSSFVDGMAMAQILATRYAMPPHFKP